MYARLGGVSSVSSFHPIVVQQLPELIKGEYTCLSFKTLDSCVLGHQVAWDLTTEAISGSTGWGLPTSLTPLENQSPAANESLAMCRQAAG